MRKLLYIPLILIISILSSCFKDYEERYLFTENRIEFDDAVTNPNASGKTFPRLPGLSFDAGIVKYRVNMTGEQNKEDRTVQFRIVPEESTARIDVDYRLPGGESFVIPANSSFGWVEVEVLPDGSGSPTLVLELLETDGIKVMDRYHQIGLQILYPSTPPNPDEVERVNDITFFKDITFGSSSNQNIGNYIDLITGYAYIGSGADAKPQNIDFIILRSSAGTEHNIVTPSSSSVTAWASAKHIPETWHTRNDGVLMRIPNPSIAEQSLFDDATTKADLINAYEEMLVNITSRPGYNSTNDGPSTRIRAVGQGDLVIFYSNDRDVISIMKVEEMVPGATGFIRGQVKTGGEG